MDIITTVERQSKSMPLKEFDAFAAADDFIEVTEWGNCEGFDIHINSKAGKQSFSLTNGESKALNFLISVF